MKIILYVECGRKECTKNLVKDEFLGRQNMKKIDNKSERYIRADYTCKRCGNSINVELQMSNEKDEN